MREAPITFLWPTRSQRLCAVRRRAPRVARVVFECQPPLLRLFQSSALGDTVRVVARDDNGSVPDHDVQSALLSLPRLAGTDADTVPATTPYLSPPDDADFPALRESGVHVGIAWAGKPPREALQIAIAEAYGRA